MQTGRIRLAFEGQDANELAIDRHTGKNVVEVNWKYYRPSVAELLSGNPSKAKREKSQTRAGLGTRSQA